MPIPTFRTFIPVLTTLIRAACHYAVKHRSKILEATAVLDPDQVANMTTALDAISTACALIEAVETLLDPNN